YLVFIPATPPQPNSLTPVSLHHALPIGLRGPGLRDVLSSLARSARADLDMRRRIAASRSSTRRSVQIVIAVTVLFVLGLAIFNRDRKSTRLNSSHVKSSHAVVCLRRTAV